MGWGELSENRKKIYEKLFFHFTSIWGIIDLQAQDIV